MPKTIDADTDIHVGMPKLRLPTSENACPFIFFNFVHRTTSQGGALVSVSPGSRSNWLLREARREFPVMNDGEEARGILSEGDESLDWNRLSKGRKDGVGLWRPALEATDGNIPLPPGDDNTDPCGES